MYFKAGHKARVKMRLVLAELPSGLRQLLTGSILDTRFARSGIEGLGQVTYLNHDLEKASCRIAFTASLQQSFSLHQQKLNIFLQFLCVRVNRFSILY